MGPCKTYMTLLKGFVCCAVLTLPRSFINGGWMFQLFTLTFAAALATYCCILLLEVREKLNASSYTAIGEMTLGKWGKALVNISLCSSQIGFVCVHVYFIKDNFANLVYHNFGWDEEKA